MEISIRNDIDREEKEQGALEGEPEKTISNEEEEANNNETTNNSDKKSSGESSRCYRCNMKLPYCQSLTTEWPRTMAILLGVVVPLFSLICFAIFFAVWLAQAEGPNEVEANNAFLAAMDEVQIFSNVTSLMPVICFEIFLMQRDDVSLLESEIRSRIFNRSTSFTMSNVTEIGTLLSGNLTVVNTNEMHDFMWNCGEQFTGIVNSLFTEEFIGTSNDTTELTFNWIRCVPGAGNMKLSFGLHTDVRDMQYQSQAKLFTETWRQDQQRLYQQYLQEEVKNTNSSSSSVDRQEAKEWAYDESVQNATGITTCDLNLAGTAWFWFTVMTTVGYGNQVPVTSTGRTMVFTLGLLSILSFGGVLATAGSITLAIWEDVAARTNLHRLNIPSVAFLFWGGLWYTWMVLIAGVTQRWKRDRLGHGTTPPFLDMYWFGYVSTSTIGFGDVFLEPEVFVGQDLLSFSLLFLVGFVFLAAFLGKFSDMLRYWFLGKGKKSLVETLIGKLHSTAPVNLPVDIPGIDLTVTPDLGKNR